MPGLSLLLLLLTVTALPAQSLSSRIEAHLSSNGLKPAQWGIQVTDSGGRVLYRHNADQLMTPASNAKLAVTATALGLLGRDFTVTTSLYGPLPVNGRISGDLVLYGRGDPSFSRRCYSSDTLLPGSCDRDINVKLRELANQLSRLGTREIAGDLIADGSWFEPQRTHPTWDAYDLGWYYAAPVSALAYNDNAIDVVTDAGLTVGSRPLVTITPDLGLSEFRSEAVTGARGSSRTYDIFRSQDGLSYRATGSVPLGTSKLEWPAVADPDRFMGLALRAELERAGIRLSGRVRSTADSSLTANARRNPPLAEVGSRPLADWLFPILNVSQNLFAEMLLKQVGRQAGGSGSWSAGLAVEQRFLSDSLRLPPETLQLVDGSGLSARNRITAAALATILRYLWQGPERSLLLSDLPRAGYTGTLKNRLTAPGQAGRVWAKTGMIGGVASLSGFARRDDGSMVVFAILVNAPGLSGSRMNAAIDAVVSEILR